MPFRTNKNKYPKGNRIKMTENGIINMERCLKQSQSIQIKLKPKELKQSKTNRHKWWITIIKNKTNLCTEVKNPN